MADLPLIALSLAVLALTIVVVRLGRRLGDVEEALVEATRDQAARGDRAERLLQALQSRSGEDRVGHRLAELTDAQRRLTADLGGLERRVVQQLKRDTPVAAASAPRLDPATVVGRHLDAHGFDDVRILTDVASTHADGGHVSFEAWRSGVVHKGHAVVEDGRVVDEAVRPAYGAFP